MRRFASLAVIAAVLSAGAAAAQDAEAIRTAEQLRDRAMQGSGAYAVVEEITTRFGPRLAGTEAEQRAAAWGEAYLRREGFQNVRQETFPLAVWTRGIDRAEIVGDHAQPLSVVALGGSGATAEGGVEAEAVIFETYQQMLDAPEGALRGKIAVVLQETVRMQDGSGYGVTSTIRGQGPEEAARRGAVGFLLRSLGTHDHRFAHTGATRWLDEPIPSFALSPPDAEQLARIAALSNRPLRLRLHSGAGRVLEGRSQNVIAEVRGREAPEEVIVIGAHMDSWDLGTGAIDDAAGIAIVTRAARLIADLPERPRRTIRVVWFGAEEVSQPGGTGLAGGRDYVTRHRETFDRHVAASESDFGARPIYSLALPAGFSDQTFLAAARRVLTPIGVNVSPAPNQGGGPDIIPMATAGVPTFRLNQDGSDYFDTHHTVDDVIDRIEPEDLDQNVAAWAAVLWLMADSEVSLRPAS
ncbi:M20/M25/M40 family metallo-hydrolase [Brevundimonas sp. 2R-24]|uniref:Carboxypeptidase Q n=1 Tax=Peiella sedimenti TaxID=3061083 RepID=A0ABT8SMZ0_9CAUL|nr:M20/M25/M40 family metallo-hydrolase [Caulobacteraceae bacterium XZ-24]